MASNSGFRKTTINLIWQFIYQAVNLALGLVLPYILIRSYGSAVNGLTNTIKNLAIVITLAQAGISTTVTFRMYKLVNDGNRVEIAQHLRSVTKLFRIIGLITLGAGLVASLLMAFLQKSDIQWYLIFIACFLFSIYCALDLAFTIKYNIFFTATQDKYIVSISLLIFSIFSYGVEILLALLKVPFVIIYGCAIMACILKLLFLYLVFKKKYKEYAPLPDEVVEDKVIKVSGIGYATINEVAHSLVVAAPSIIITMICGLNEASVYTTYAMVINALFLVGQVIYTSFAPSFGALCAKGDMNRVNEVFRIFQNVYDAITIFLFATAAFLLLPFVSIYAKGAEDINYVSVMLLYGFIIFGLFYCLRVPYNIVVSSSGLFKPSGIQTGITALVSIGLSIGMAFIDYQLVILGPILFYVANTVYQYFMTEKLFKGFRSRPFWLHVIIAAIILAGAFTFYFLQPESIIPTNFLMWFVVAVIAALAIMVLTFLLFFAIDHKSTMMSAKYFLGKLKRRK